MEKSIAGLLGAVSALAVASPSHAASNPAPALNEVMQANSYADLLKPIPNAVAVRQAYIESQQPVADEPEVMQVQYYYHHHHHHHRYYERRWHHHHHHHHRHSVRIGPVVIR